MSDGSKGVVRCSYYARTLSKPADSHSDHELVDVRYSSCSTSISLKRPFSFSPLKIISIERS